MSLVSTKIESVPVFISRLNRYFKIDVAIYFEYFEGVKDINLFTRKHIYEVIVDNIHIIRSYRFNKYRQTYNHFSRLTQTEKDIISAILFEKISDSQILKSYFASIKNEI